MVKRNNGIDLFRLIGAFFVLVLHANYRNLDTDYVNNLRLLARWAVPFYFITTGYFWGLKMENGKAELSKIQHNISTLITILIVSSLIYAPVGIIIKVFSFDLETLFTGTFFHLWFIGSMIFGYIFIWYLYYNKKEKLLPYASVCIILLALLASSYDQLLHRNLGYYTARFLLSVPFMYLGIYLSKKTFSISSFLLVAIILLGVALQVIEAEYIASLTNFDKYLHEFLIGTICIVVPLFILSLTINIKESLLTKWGKEYSLFIYLYHPIVYLLMNAVAGRVFLEYSGKGLLLIPVVGFIIVLSTALFLNKYLNRIYKLLTGILQ